MNRKQFLCRLGLLLVLFASFSCIATSQNPPKILHIPFEYKNDFIIINVIFDRRLPLKFIFDTGAENTILSKKEITDLLQVDYDRTFTIYGSDMRTELTAYLATGIHFLAGDLVQENLPVLVLEEDYFYFEEFTGEKIHGILGANLFRRFVVKIDYRRQLITLINPGIFEGPKEGFSEIPLTISRNKPYFQTEVRLPNQEKVSVKLLLDTGASLSLLINTDTKPNLQLPESTVTGNIGRGLGGFLEGYRGIVPELLLPPYSFEQVPANFQEMPLLIDSTYTDDRNGLIGNQILSRFTIYIDYLRSKMYLQPNKNIDKEFPRDKSGISVIATGAGLNTFVIQSVVAGSPADLAGLKRGDIIKKINWLSTSFLGLADITRALQRRTGKKIKLKVLRNQERLKFEFRLADYLFH